MLWVLGGIAFVVFALKAAEHRPLSLPKTRKLGWISLAPESVDYLARTYGVARHEVEIVGEGYDRKKHMQWAWTRAPYRGGMCADVTTRPDGGSIVHEHYCNVAA